MSTTHTVCVHDLGQARQTLACARALGRAVTLLSAPGAAGFAGAGWWRAVVAAASEAEGVACADLLDCADAAGYAMAALRLGQRGLVLRPDTPALEAVRGAALAVGAMVLTARPDHLDLGRADHCLRLRAWLAAPH